MEKHTYQNRRILRTTLTCERCGDRDERVAESSVDGVRGPSS
jgi:hypothetical protein